MAQACYIGGLGRSGTTLLERILAQTTGACALGEVVWVWQRGLVGDEMCGCGQRFSRCDFWQSIGREAFGGWDRIDAMAVDELRRSIDHMRNVPALALLERTRRRGREYSDYVAAIYDAAREITGASVVIDSSKHPALAFALRSNPRIDLKVVHVVRDSRGVAYSWTKTMVRPEASEASPIRLMYRYAPWRSAVLWDLHNLEFAMLRAIPGASRTLRYEDLLARPLQTIEELAGFIGAEADPSHTFLDARTVALEPAHQISGNPMRLRTGPIELREDNAWRSALPTRSRRAVSVLTLPLLFWYGYLRPKRADQ
jgi:hypothetical protein